MLQSQKSIYPPGKQAVNTEYAPGHDHRQALRGRRIFVSPFRILEHGVVVYTGVEVQGCKNRDDARPGQKYTIYPVLFGGEQANKHRHRQKLAPVLHRIAYYKP